jgi:hypothetical protein
VRAGRSPWRTSRHAARIAALYARDRALRPRARTRHDVPAFPTSVTPEWFTDVLCEGSAGSVVDWRYEPVSRGSTSRGRYLLAVEGDPEGRVPATVFAKATSTFRTRFQLGSTGAIRAETRFYREIQPTVDVLAPVGYFGASDRRTGRSILLLEDLGRTRDVTFADNRTLRVDRELASSLVATLGALHGSLLESARFAGDLRWVISSLDLQRHLNALVGFERRMLVGFDRAGDLMPPPLRAQRDRIPALQMASLELDAGQPLGLVHTDTHLGNWFVTGDRRMGLCDWAGVARGQGPRDLAYALMSALAVEERRAWERELVAEYAEAVSAAAGSTVPAAEAWDAYRQQTMHGLCFWLYTLGSGGLQPHTQAEEISRINLARMAQAVVDLETLSTLAV